MTVKFNTSLFIVLWGDLGTAEWEQCRSLPAALAQIQDYLGTLEPNCVLELTPEGA